MPNQRKLNKKEEENIRKYLEKAEEESKKSIDPKARVGCCIVKNDHIIAVGFNETPIREKKKGLAMFRGFKIWSKDNKNELPNEPLYVHHAARRAVFNAIESVKGSTLYTTLYPCSACANIIVTHGIVKVVYLASEKSRQKKLERNQFKADPNIFEATGVTVEKFDL